MRRAAAPSAGRRVSNPAVAHIAAVVGSAAVAVAASATARRVRCTPRRARAADAKRRCLSSPARTVQSTVAIVISPSPVAGSVLVLLADRAGNRHDADYCKPQWLV